MKKEKANIKFRKMKVLSPGLGLERHSGRTRKIMLFDFHVFMGLIIQKEKKMVYEKSKLF